MLLELDQMVGRLLWLTAWQQAQLISLHFTCCTDFPNFTMWGFQPGRFSWVLHQLAPGPGSAAASKLWVMEVLEVNSAVAPPAVSCAVFWPLSSTFFLPRSPQDVPSLPAFASPPLTSITFSFGCASFHHIQSIRPSSLAPSPVSASSPPLFCL